MYYNLWSFSCKNYASRLLSDSEVVYLGKERMLHFVHLAFVFCLYTALHNRIYIYIYIYIYITNMNE